MLTSLSPLPVIAPPSTMAAAILTAPRTFEVVETKTPSPKATEVLVRLESCGVCHSSLPRWQGRPWFDYPSQPGEMGHEGIGIVEKIGAACQLDLLGKRVAMLSNHAYAQYDVADKCAIAILPPELNSKNFLGEPCGCAWNIFERAGITPKCRVAIVGIGFLGALLVQLINSYGASVTAISRRTFARTLAKSLGATATLPFTSVQNTAQAALNQSEGEHFDVVIEAVGSQEALDLASELTCTRGRLVIAGYHQDGTRSINLQNWNWKGIDVINAHERAPDRYLHGIQKAIDAAKMGVLACKPLITHQIPLDHINNAFEKMESRPDGFLKAIITL